MRKAIAELREQYRSQQGETAMILHQMNEDLVNRLVMVDLSESQEQEMETTLNSAIDKALDLFREGPDFDGQLGALMKSLAVGLDPRQG